MKGHADRQRRTLRVIPGQCRLRPQQHREQAGPERLHEFLRDPRDSCRNAGDDKGEATSKPKGVDSGTIFARRSNAVPRKEKASVATT